jgi:hypothetical protein
MMRTHNYVIANDGLVDEFVTREGIVRLFPYRASASDVTSVGDAACYSLINEILCGAKLSPKAKRLFVVCRYFLDNVTINRPTRKS